MVGADPVRQQKIIYDNDGILFKNKNKKLQLTLNRIVVYLYADSKGAMDHERFMASFSFF